MGVSTGHLNASSSTDTFLHHHSAPMPTDGPTPIAPVDVHLWRERFPRMLWDDAVTQAVAQLAEQGPCAAVVMRVRSDAATADDGDVTPADDAHPTVTAAIPVDALCGDAGGAWGLRPDGTLCGVVPGMAAAAVARRLASLPADVAARHPGTVVLGGTADHPLLDYGPGDLVANTMKALAHASFFDGGAIVPLDAVTLNISGDRLFDAGDITAAMAEYQNALQLDAGDANVLNSLGACYGHLGAYEKALGYFERAAAAAPEDHMAVYNIGLTRLLMGDRQRALGQFTEAAGMAPAVFETVFQLGRLLLEEHRPEAALGHLETAAGLHPGSATVHKLLGQCHEALDQVEAAIAAYKKAVTLHPNDPETLSALGCLFDRKGENPEITIIFCQQSVDLAPDNGVYRRRLGKRYLNQGRLEEALEAFKAAERCGTDAQALIETVLERMDTPPGADIPN